MARQETVISAFVASPSDVADERAVLEEIVREFNLTWSRHLSVRIELIRWETHSYPSAGENAQAVINKQIGDNYDIFIGIMWGRFGMPTQKNESGTEEEFERAFSRHVSDPNSVRIMFYFKDGPLSPSKMDPGQLSKVHTFKKKLGDEGTYHWSFNNREQFASFLRLHLSRVIQDWRLSAPSTQTQRISSPSDENASLEVNSSSETEELGFLDFLGSSMRAAELSTNSALNLAAATNGLTQSLSERTDELNAAKAKRGGFDLQAANRISNRAAQDMEVFVSRTEAELPIFAQYYRTSVEQFSKAINLGVQDFNTDRASIEALRVVLAAHAILIPEMGDKIRGVRDVVARLPRVTSQFNKARRHTVEVLDKLLLEVETAIQSNTEAIKLLDTILASL